MDNFSVVDIKNRQYVVYPGLVLTTAKLNAKVGDKKEFDKVLLSNKTGKVDIGDPYLDKSVVKYEVIEHKRAKKITINKFKAKSRYRKKIGHRQDQSVINILSI